MDHNTCWQCDQPTRELFCNRCGTLQPPPGAYFVIFEMDERLALDLDLLQKRFYELSRKLHPDLYTRKPETERQYSLEATAVLNDAYRTLRDPVKRAEYVLKLHGFEIGEQRSKNVPPELLEEVFDLNMAIEEIRGGDESVRPQLESAHRNFVGMREQIDRQLDERFREYDSNRAKETLAEIRGILNRRRYVENLINEVEKELSTGVRK